MRVAETGHRSFHLHLLKGPGGGRSTEAADPGLANEVERGIGGLAGGGRDAAIGFWRALHEPVCRVAATEDFGELIGVRGAKDRKPFRQAAGLLRPLKQSEGKTGTIGIEIERGKLSCTFHSRHDGENLARLVKGKPRTSVRYARDRIGAQGGVSTKALRVAVSTISASASLFCVRNRRTAFDVSGPKTP